MGVNDFLKLLKEDMNFDSYEGESLDEDGTIDMPVETEDDNEDEITHIKLPNMIPIDKKFVSSLVSYVDKRFVDYENFNSALGVEIRKYMDTKDQAKVVLAKKKIYKILIDEKVKFLEKLRKRIERVIVLKKI